jgi:phosphinothricin acetyltransferase
VGFATYGDFRDSIKKPGYRFTVEHSVNIAQRAWRSGLGTQLMQTLIDRAQRAGLHSMVGGIDASNERSLVFHERLGFREVARMPESGWKHGRWCDLVLVQKRLSDSLPGQ